MQTPLTLASLGELDCGTARAVIDKAIADAMADLDDRGEDGKPRQVNIMLVLARLDAGKSSMVGAHIEAEAKLPKRRTASTIGLLRTNANQTQMIFNDLSPTDPHQRTVDEFSKE